MSISFVNFATLRWLKFVKCADITLKLRVIWQLQNKIQNTAINLIIFVILTN